MNIISKNVCFQMHLFVATIFFESTRNLAYNSERVIVVFRTINLHQYIGKFPFLLNIVKCY